MGGSRDLDETASNLGLPADLLTESEQFRHSSGEIYPDNLPVVNIFRDMLTQWRMGFSGPTGLDYKALPVVLSIRRVKAADRENIFDGLRVMERAALAAIREK